MIVPIIALLLLLSGIFLSLTKPKWLLFAMIFFAGWHSIFVDIGFTVTAYRFIVVMCWIGLPIHYAVRKQDLILKLPPSIKWLFVFVFYSMALTLIAGVATPEVGIAGFARGQGRWLFQIAMLFITISPAFFPLMLFKNTSDLKTAVNVYIASTALLCAIGWVQTLAFYFYGAFLFPVFREGLTGSLTQAMAAPMFGMTIFRMHSLGGEPRDFSMTVAIAIVLLLIARMGWHEKLRFSNLLLGFFLASLFMSLSTSGLVILVIGLIVMLLFYYGKQEAKPAFKFIAAIAFMTVLFFAIIVSAGILPLDIVKDILWERTFARTPLEIFDAATLKFLSANLRHTVFGVGIGSIHLYVRDYLVQYGLYNQDAAWVVPIARDIIFVPNSGYLKTITEVGITGLLLFLVAYLGPIRCNLKYSQHLSDNGLKGLVFGLSTFAIFVVIAYLMRVYLIDIAFITLGWIYFLNREANAILRRS